MSSCCPCGQPPAFSMLFFILLTALLRDQLRLHLESVADRSDVEEFFSILNLYFSSEISKRELTNLPIKDFARKILRRFLFFMEIYHIDNAIVFNVNMPFQTEPQYFLIPNLIEPFLFSKYALYSPFSSTFISNKRLCSAILLTLIVLILFL